MSRTVKKQIDQWLADATGMRSTIIGSQTVQARGTQGKLDSEAEILIHELKGSQSINRSRYISKAFVVPRSRGRMQNVRANVVKRERGLSTRRPLKIKKKAFRDPAALPAPPSLRAVPR